MTLVEPEDRPRRRPSQARSRRRYEAILEAAATLFAESGFDGVTTEAIAAAAGTSIGSLYQFFPGKKAIFVTLAERLMERENALFEEVVAEAQGRPWDELVEAVVDAFAHLQDTEPAWRAVWSSHLALVGEVAETGERYQRRIVERRAAILGGYAPALSEERRETVATTLVETVAAMLFAGLRYERPRSRALLAETKRMIRLYTADVLAQG